MLQEHKNIRTVNYVMIVIALIISDWRIKTNLFSKSLSFPISEFLILISAVLVLRLFVKYVDKRHVVIFGSIIILNIVLSLLFNPGFVLAKSITLLIKLPIYYVFLYGNIILIKENNEELYVLKILNIATLVIVLISYYITFAISSGNLPYKFLWTFTRQDKLSYMYRKTDIIRGRSLFSEPSYFGLFLNIVLSLNVLIDKPAFKKKETLYLYVVALIISIISTLSLGNIFLMPLILFISLIQKIIKNQVEVKKALLLISILALFGLMLVVVKYDDFNRVIFKRLVLLLSGKDNSSMSRLFGSWSKPYSLLIGNGLGNTKAIWNNLAYIYADFGIIILIFYLFITYISFTDKVPWFVFILIHFFKGGYISSFNIIFILLFMMFYYQKADMKKDVEIT